MSGGRSTRCPSGPGRRCLTHAGTERWGDAPAAREAHLLADALRRVAGLRALSRLDLTNPTGLLGLCGLSIEVIAFSASMVVKIPSTALFFTTTAEPHFRCAILCAVSASAVSGVTERTYRSRFEEARLVC